MTLVLKHKFQSLKVDGGDTSLIRPSNWNDDHNLEGKAWSLPFRAAGTAGAMTDVALGDGLYFDATAGKLDVNMTGLAGFFFMDTAPAGWLKANGALLSRTTYANLFGKIGTLYGVGDGATTFALPDIRGYFARAWDDGRGIDVGRVFGSSQLDQNAIHTHGITQSAHAHGVSDPSHAHGIGDPGHAHTYALWNGTSGRLDGAGGNGTPSVAAHIPTAAAGTGIWVGGAFTGIAIAGANANITINNQGGDGRPRNFALLGCIKI